MKNLILIFITLLCFTKGNAQWYKVDSKTTENINDIFFVDKNVGYCATPDGILKSTDGGDNWDEIYETTNPINFTYIVAYKDTVIAFGHNDNDGIDYKYTSADNGNTWENEVINYYPLSVQLNNNNIFFKDINDLWKLKKLSNGIITTISDNATVYGVNKDEIVYVGGSRDSIYKSVNSGLTWNPLSSFPRIYNTTDDSRVKSFNDTIIYRNVYPNYIDVSYDNGKNWVRRDGGDPWVGTIVNSSTLYTAGNNNLYIGNLEGDWVLQASLAGERIEKLYFYDDNLGFAIGKNGIIYKTNNGGSLGVSENRKLEKNIKIFPIPSKKLIKLEIPSDIIVDSLQIYNIQGKLIKTFKNSKRELKVDDLATGNYLLKIKTNKGTLTKRIIIG